MISNEQLLLGGIVSATKSLISSVTDTAKENSFAVIVKNVKNLQFLTKKNDVNDIIKKYVINGFVEINGKPIYNKIYTEKKSYKPLKFIASQEDWSHLDN